MIRLQVRAVHQKRGLGLHLTVLQRRRLEIAAQARTAVALLDALGIQRAYWVGNSQGGQSAMVAAITYPERVRKFVMGGSHIGTGGDGYLLANRPSEGSRATRQALDDPSRENIRHYLACTSTTRAR